MNNSNSSSKTGFESGREEIKTHVIIFKISYILLFFIGLFGNVSCFLIFSKNPLKNSTTSIYLRFLAIFDTLTLFAQSYLRLFKYIETHVTDNQSAYRYYFCAFDSAIPPFFITSSAWILVAMNIDRSIFIILPTKAASICTKKRAVIASSSIILIHFFYYSHELFMYDEPLILKSSTSKWNDIFLCSYQTKSIEFYERNIHSIILLTDLSILPSTVLLITNSILLIKIIKAKKLRKKLSIANINRSDNENNSIFLATFLIFLSVYFILTSLPLASLHVYVQYFNNKPTLKEARTILILALSLSLFSQTNNSFNFYIYCLSGKRYRKEFLYLFKYNKKSNNDIININSPDSTLFKATSIQSNVL